MLMNAASGSIKTVIKNIDDYLLRPLGETLFHWNMQFNKDVPEIQGDLNVKAQGTTSLMTKEVRSQRLMTPVQANAVKKAMKESAVAETVESMGSFRQGRKITKN